MCDIIFCKVPGKKKKSANNHCYACCMTIKFYTFITLGAILALNALGYYEWINFDKPLCYNFHLFILPGEDMIQG